MFMWNQWINKQMLKINMKSKNYDIKGLKSNL